MKRLKRETWMWHFALRIGQVAGGGIGLLVLAPCVATPAWAQYSLPRFSIAGGGITQAAGASYTLSATIGQPIVGSISGGGYSLGGGFWGGGTITTTDFDPEDIAIGSTTLAFRLHAASPNPLVRHTIVAFDTPQERAVRVQLFDASGRLVRSLANEWLPAGRHRRAWDGADTTGRRVAAGIYFLRVESGANVAHDRIVVIR